MLDLGYHLGTGPLAPKGPLWSPLDCKSLKREVIQLELVASVQLTQGGGVGSSFPGGGGI